MSDKKKLAIIGIGKMGLLHTSLINTFPEVELTAVCENNFLVRTTFNKVLKDVIFVDDVEKLSKFGLDAIYITTPVNSHFPIAKLIYFKNIAANIFMEKPLASSARQAVEICDLANNKSGITMVGYQRRYTVTFRKAKELVESGELGDIESFEGYAYSSDFCNSETEVQINARGGVLLDLGCHAIDMTLWFFDDLKVNSRLKNSQNDEPADFISFSVENPANVQGKVMSSRCMESYRMPEIGIKARGSKGSLHVNDDYLELTMDKGSSNKWYRQDLNDSTDFFLGGAEYYRENEHFIQSLFSHNKCAPDFNEALKVQQLIDYMNEKVYSNEL
jgi:predicted dehydrogenase